MKQILFFIFWIAGLSVLANNSNVNQDEIEQIKSYYDIGLIEFSKNDFDDAYLNFKLGLDESNRLNDNLQIAFGKYHLSGLFLSQKKYLESIDFVTEALELFQKLNKDFQVSNCYTRLGDIYFKISNFDKSHFYYLEALKISEEHSDVKRIADNLGKIGDIYKITPDPNLDLPKARINFNKALVLYEKLNDEQGIISSLTNIGAIDLKEGINHNDNEKIVKAIKVFKEALEKANNLGIERSQAILLGNIGPSLRMLNRNQESLEYLFKALEIKLKLKDYTSAAHSCNDISETYMAMNDLLNAESYALQAVKLAKGVSLNQERFAYYLLSEIRYILGEYKQSNSDLKQFYKLADSIFSLKKLASINEMQIKYDTAKRDLKIQAQESNIALLNEKSKVKNQYMIFGSLGLLSVFGFVLLVRSRNRVKAQRLLQEQFSHELLESQENERTRIAKELHDSVGQQLTLIKKKSQNSNLVEITNLTHNALEEVRGISRGLYPAMLKQLGLKESIEQLIYDYDMETDLFFTSEIDEIDSFLNKDESLNFYRFIQECLTNIIKHAKAKTVSFTVKKTEDRIISILSDNGIGFNAKDTVKQNSLGLKTISERIRMLKGNLTIESAPNKGTAITAIIPLK